ncbi:Cytochrome P450 52A3, partial [Mortierella sp. AM989]
MFYLILCDGAKRNIIKKLAQEVDDVLEDQELTYESHRQQKYADTCSQALSSSRYYAVLVVLRNLKQCVAGDTLPGCVKVRKSELIDGSSYVLGRSELIWGPGNRNVTDACTETINIKKPSQGKFNSFHMGPRVCLGQQFATIEALTVIRMILQSFELQLVNPRRPLLRRLGHDVSAGG